VEKFIENKVSSQDPRMKKQKLIDGYVWEGKKSIRRGKTEKSEHRGSEVLTEEEEKLCDSLELSLYHYLVIKETMVRESLREGFLRKDEAEKIFKIDRKKIHRVYDYLLSIKKIQEHK
jgi:transcriptional adapter 2-alpha